MLKKYPDDVRLVIKHYPLRSHRVAEQAALAALAAQRQGKYLELSKVLLENYKTLTSDSIKKHARSVGLDMDKFAKDSADMALKTIIKQDMQTGRSVGVRGVPSLFVNGRAAKKRSLSALSRMVEQERGKK